MYHEYQQLIHKNDGGGATLAKRFHYADADEQDQLEAVSEKASIGSKIASAKARGLRMALSVEQTGDDDGLSAIAVPVSVIIDNDKELADPNADKLFDQQMELDEPLYDDPPALRLDSAAAMASGESAYMATSDTDTVIGGNAESDAMLVDEDTTMTATEMVPNPFRLNLNGDSVNSAAPPPDSATCIELEGLHLARAHWMQMHKLNLQVRIVQRMFVHLLKRHREMRPIWQFARQVVDYRRDDWSQKLIAYPPFKIHCTSVQAALTMIMDNLDKSGALTRLLRELGTHHFYYDALESHLCRMCDAFIAALRDTAAVSLDERLLDGWIEFWSQVTTHMGSGITQQRHIYLTQCVTAVEMDVVRRTWQWIRDRGVTDAAQLVTSTGVKVLEELLDRYGMIDGSADGQSLTNGGNSHDDLALKCERFVRYANELLSTLDRTIQYYSVEAGFAGLAEEMRSFVHWSVLVELCAPLVRRAFMEGLTLLLNTALHHNYDPHHQPHYPPREPLSGDDNTSFDSVMATVVMDESMTHIWSKMYRVHEQAIIANVELADLTPSEFSSRQGI